MKGLLLIELGTSKALSKQSTLLDGELFIRYDREADTLFYLENLPKKNSKKKCSLVSCNLKEDLKTEKSEKTILDFDGINIDFSDVRKG